MDKTPEEIRENIIKRDREILEDMKNNNSLKDIERRICKIEKWIKRREEGDKLLAEILEIYNEGRKNIRKYYQGGKSDE